MPRKFITFLLFVLLQTGFAAEEETTLTPDLTYYDGPEKLTGKLMFLVDQDCRLHTNASSRASVYEFDLASKKLRKVVDCPYGLLIPSFQGDMFCVVDVRDEWSGSGGTNAFIYSESLGLSRTLNLESKQKLVVLSGGHAFFVLEGSSHHFPGHYVTKRGTYVGTKILDFDIAKNKTRFVELPEASQWEYETYDIIHSSRKQANILHFQYYGTGKRITNGKDYPSCVYSMNIDTGDIRPLGEANKDKDDDGYYQYGSFYEGYAFFNAPGDTSDSDSGFKLVSSLWDNFETREDHAKDPQVGVLKRFSALSAVARRQYRLPNSPDGRFAFLGVRELTVPKNPFSSGSADKYYALDLSNGSLRLLLKSTLQHDTYDDMSYVSWVENPK